MSWKNSVQLSDLDRGEYIELHCNACGFVRFIRDPHMMTHPVSGKDISHLYVDELEARARCVSAKGMALAARKCGGTVHLILIDPATKPAAFIAGMATTTYDPAEAWERGERRRDRAAERRARSGSGHKFKRKVG